MGQARHGVHRSCANGPGKNLTLIGAIRLDGWVVLSTMFATTNKERFVAWLRKRLLPNLRKGDVLVMDNLDAHHDPRVKPLCQARGVKVLYLPPYSPDLNPIESGWALQKQYVRKHAPRSPTALRRIARRARYRVSKRHCRNWFAHAGYHVQQGSAVRPASLQQRGAWREVGCCLCSELWVSGWSWVQKATSA